MNDLATKCLGNGKFICGDELTVADFIVGGIYTNLVKNPRNKCAALWEESYAQAPERLVQYVNDFEEAMAEYLAARCQTSTM